MSGKDERKVKFITCKCGRFKCWTMRTKDRNSIGYLNDEKYLGIEVGATIDFLNPKVIGRVNIKVYRKTLGEYLELLKYFYCARCRRHVSKYSPNAKPLLAYLKKYWNERTGLRTEYRQNV